MVEVLPSFWRMFRAMVQNSPSPSAIALVLEGSQTHSAQVQTMSLESIAPEVAIINL